MENTKTTTDNIEMGTILYKYITMRGVGKYEVIAKGTDFLIVKSLNCNNQSHPCIIKINRVDNTKSRWKYVSMLEYCGDDTYEDEYGEEVHNEHMWHNDSNYFEKRSDCNKDYGQTILKRYGQDLKKAQEEEAAIQRRIKSLQNSIQDLSNWMNNEDGTH